MFGLIQAIVGRTRRSRRRLFWMNIIGEGPTDAFKDAYLDQDNWVYPGSRIGHRVMTEDLNLRLS